MLKPLFLSCALLLTTVQAGAALEPAQALAAPFQLAAASGHRLSAAQIQKLRSSGVPLVVPGYVPAGYVVERVEVAVDDNGFCGGTYYTIYYINRKNEAFDITGNCPAGIGITDMQMKIQNKYFGPIDLSRYGGKHDAKRSNYDASFRYRGVTYDISSKGFFNDPHHKNQLRISGPEIIKIIQNLRPL